MAGLRDFRDRVAVVTGASSGIGLQLARDLSARGMRVAVLARRVDRLQVLADELGAASGRAVAIACDVGERASVDAAMRQVEATWGKIDLLVNCAGYVHHVLFKDEEPDEFERMMRTNYLGVVYAIQAVLPGMRARRSGWIMNVSSVAGRLGQPDESAYSATKFAVTGLTEALVYELAPLGIHVMAVYPTLVRTEMFTPDVLARMPERVQRTFVEPAAFTRAVLRALERGRHEVTMPWYVNLAYVVRALLPGFHRRTTAGLRLPALPDLKR